MTLREQLIKDAEAFCATKNYSLGRLGILVVNDGKFFDGIKAGNDCTTRTLERFQTYFHENTNGKQAA